MDSLNRGGKRKNNFETRPYGKRNQQMLTDELWRELKGWLVQAFNSNGHEANGPLAIAQVMQIRKEVGDLYELFSRPNYQETQLARTVPDVHDVSDPKCQMESSLYIRTRHFVEKIVEKYELRYDDSLRSRNLLITYANDVQKFTKIARHYNIICSHLNNSWIKSRTTKADSDVVEIFNLFQRVWRCKIHKKVRVELKDAVLEEIRRDRDILARGQVEGGQLEVPVNSAAIQIVLTSLNDMRFLYESDMDREELASNVYAALDASEKKSLLDIFVYRTYFENDYITETSVFLSQRSNQIKGDARNTRNPRRLMDKVSDLIRVEEARLSWGFNRRTSPRLQQLIDRTLILDNIPVYEAACSTLLNGNKQEDVRLLYNLISRCGPEVEIRMAEVYQTVMITRQKNKIVKMIRNGNVPHCRQFCASLIRLYGEHREMVVNVLENKKVYQDALTRACNEALRDNALTRLEQVEPEEIPGLLFAQYTDAILKKNDRGQKFFRNDDNNEVAIQNLRVIVTLVAQLSVASITKYFRTYQYHLGKRLVFDTSISIDLEAEMVGWLSNETNYGTAIDSLAKMINDERDSAEFVRMIQRQSLEVNGNEGKMEMWAPVEPQLSFMFKSSDATDWPFPTDSSLNWVIPNALKPALDQAKDIFRTKHRSKNLNMHLSVQTGELFWWPKQNEPNNKYTIMVNFQLAAVLLLFGDADEASEEMITNSTRIGDRDVLALALQVLSTSIWVQQETKRKRDRAPIAPKQNAVDMILTKIVTGEGETSVTRYRVNENFSHDSENGQINLLPFFTSRAS